MSNANEPAFPFTHNPMEVQSEGLTKREVFAAMAMQGILANSAPDVPKSGGCDDWNYESIAKSATQAADELLKQLNS